MDKDLETFVRLAFKRKKGQWVADSGDYAHDVLIIDAVSRALYWQSLLDSGAFKSIVEIAGDEGMKPTTVARLLRLARLAPDIVEQLMAGHQPRRLTLLWLMRHDVPALWPTQVRMIEPFN
ncbi:site-specific recombinase resolvase [Massilia sp. PWRC2]|uniref:site-specific recombinase resolvase n=1 Tax=Massilia sp. PWRC2 TaxID=2804626 RepID=UPI003CEB560A